MKLFKPDLKVESLTDINIPYWYDKGVRCVLIDLDNTISPWRTDNITDEAYSMISGCRDAGITVVLFTNASEKRAKEAAWKAGVAYYAKVRKPFTFRYKKAIAELGCKAGQVMAVGDQIFTDVLGGNLAGCVTVLTEPLTEVEFIGTRLLRFLEKWVVGRKLVFRGHARRFNNLTKS